jgi:hypothetical protein
MIPVVKHDLVIMAKGFALLIGPLIASFTVLDPDPDQWLWWITLTVCGLIGCIPLVRDEIAQAKQRERDGLRG